MTCSAEQLLEHIDVLEKARNDFAEFEASHQSAFKLFLNSFGFSNDEIKDIIIGNVKNLQEETKKADEISAKNDIINLFKTYNEISELQLEKINNIKKNTKESANEEPSTFHFEDLAKSINNIPMDYYRKIKLSSEEDTKQTEPQNDQNVSQTQKSQTIQNFSESNQPKTQSKTDSKQPQKKELSIETKSQDKTLNIQINKKNSNPNQRQNFFSPQKNQPNNSNQNKPPSKNKDPYQSQYLNPQKNQPNKNKQNQPAHTPIVVTKNQTPQNQVQKHQNQVKLQVQKPQSQLQLQVQRKVPNIQTKQTNTGGIKIEKKQTKPGGSLFDKK